VDGLKAALEEPGGEDPPPLGEDNPDIDETPTPDTMPDVPPEVDFPPVPMTRDRLSNPDTPRTRAVDLATYEDLYRQGAAQFQDLMDNQSPATGLEGGGWGLLKAKAARAVKEEWGGVTIDAHTGEVVDPESDEYALKYAITAKSPGVETVTVPIGSSDVEVANAMDKAKADFAEVLPYQKFHLGVFRNEDTGNVEIDPVILLDSPMDVESLGLYCNSVGGAYHFKDGLGYWPPYLAQEDVPAYAVKYAGATLPPKAPPGPHARYVDALNAVLPSTEGQPGAARREAARAALRQLVERVHAERTYYSTEGNQATLTPEQEEQYRVMPGLLNSALLGLKYNDEGKFHDAMMKAKVAAKLMPKPWPDTSEALIDVRQAWEDSLFKPDEWQLDGEGERHLNRALSAKRPEDLSAAITDLAIWQRYHPGRETVGEGWVYSQAPLLMDMSAAAMNSDLNKWGSALRSLRFTGAEQTPVGRALMAKKDELDAVMQRLTMQAESDVHADLAGRYGGLPPESTHPEEVIAAVGQFYTVREQAGQKNHNCVLASAAYELRRRGLDVHPKRADHGRNPRGAYGVWFRGVTWTSSERVEIPKGTRAKGKYERVVAALTQKDFGPDDGRTTPTVDRYPPGSRGTIDADWTGRSSGHIWNWERNEDGSVTFYDAQTGAVVQPPPEGDYWGDMGWRSVELMRLDDKPLAKDVEAMLSPPSFTQDVNGLDPDFGKALAAAKARRREAAVRSNKLYEAMRKRETALYNSRLPGEPLTPRTDDPEWVRLSEARAAASAEYTEAAKALTHLKTHPEWEKFRQVGTSAPVLPRDENRLK
jgi:hypothetical protein